MDNILIDTIILNPTLPCTYKDIIGMFTSEHDSDCCEHHYLDFEGKEEEFKTVESMLNNIDKIEIKGTPGMGITLRLYDWIREFGFFIPGRGSNNGYYSDNLTLIITLPNGFKKIYDIRKYQDIPD